MIVHRIRESLLQATQGLLLHKVSTLMAAVLEIKQSCTKALSVSLHTHISPPHTLNVIGPVQVTYDSLSVVIRSGQRPEVCNDWVNQQIKRIKQSQFTAGTT